jgi:hypothetical protein
MPMSKLHNFVFSLLLYDFHVQVRWYIAYVRFVNSVVNDLL